jgi:hypothetical protein
MSGKFRVTEQFKRAMLEKFNGQEYSDAAHLIDRRTVQITKQNTQLKACTVSSFCALTHTGI